MSAPNDPSPETPVATGGNLNEGTKPLRYSSTAEIRAFLSNLKMRPHSQRKVLCRMLRRAAVYASSKDSAVNPAVSHHTTAP